LELLVARNGGEVAALAEQAAESYTELVVGAGGDGTIDSIASASEPAAHLWMSQEARLRGCKKTTIISCGSWLRR
jgi:diacylglycerol kinase family enzyme